MGRYSSFVILAAMRTGSNFLEAQLNTLTGVNCHGELFNPLFIGKRDAEEMFGITMAARDADPLSMLVAMRAGMEGLAGFRLFHDHDSRIVDHVLADPACAKIVLTRNPAESWVSLQIALATDQWRLTNATRLKTARVSFDPAGFEAHLRAAQGFHLRIMRALQTSGQTAFHIDYDDLHDLDVLNGLARFLGVPARLEALDPRLKRQNPEPIADKILNPEAMEAALSRLDLFNLARAAGAEPRRGPGIPGFIAGAGLLYMPVRGGPEAAVTDWLARLAPDGLTGDFTQKTLRQWKRATPGHRGFTVLRHPLARAYDGYCRVVLEGQNDLFRLMTRAYKLDLPRGQDVTPEAQREGFLLFLGWLKIYLGGQTGQKIDPHLASQSATLQGLAQYQPPDAVLREDRLEDGLRWLAAERGLTAPDLHPRPDDLSIPLAAICDAEVQEAARDAYARDYQSFGFGDWRG